MGDHQFLYRVNPFCPVCGEEHCAYDIFLSEAEQERLDQYYSEQKGKSAFLLLLEKAPLVVERQFKCPVCESVFSKRVGIYREFRVGYHRESYIPMWQYPVHEE